MGDKFVKRNIVLLSLVFFFGCKDDLRFDFACGIEAKGQYPDQENSQYILPWTIGETYKVGQGNCTNGSHNTGNYSRFAYDFIMPIGTNIRAARSGEVTFIEEGHADNNKGERTSDTGNLLAIKHEDGSVAFYAHLTTLGVLVEMGQQVNQGDIIALSGNSGNSTGPHLHFEVHNCSPNDDDNCNPTSIPITFKNTTAHTNGLMQGENYTAK